MKFSSNLELHHKVINIFTMVTYHSIARYFKWSISVLFKLVKSITFNDLNLMKLTLNKNGKLTIPKLLLLSLVMLKNDDKLTEKS